MSGAFSANYNFGCRPWIDSKAQLALEPALSEEKRAQTITNIMRFGYQHILDRRYTPAGVSSVEMKVRSTGRSYLVLFSM